MTSRIKILPILIGLLTLVVVGCAKSGAGGSTGTVAAKTTIGGSITTSRSAVLYNDAPRA